MIEPRKLSVFICHASQDKPFARELYRRFLTEGWIAPWLDEEKLLPGQDWDIEIEKIVRQVDAVVVCLSTKSVNKEGYVQQEIRLILRYAGYKPENTIYLIPIRLNNCAIPTRLELQHYVDFFPSKRKEWAYSRLIESLSFRLQELNDRELDYPSLKKKTEQEHKDRKGKQLENIHGQVQNNIKQSSNIISLAFVKNEGQQNTYLDIIRIFSPTKDFRTKLKLAFPITRIILSTKRWGVLRAQQSVSKVVKNNALKSGIYHRDVKTKLIYLSPHYANYALLYAMCYVSENHLYTLRGFADNMPFPLQDWWNPPWVDVALYVSLICSEAGFRHTFTRLLRVAIGLDYKNRTEALVLLFRMLISRPMINSDLLRRLISEEILNHSRA
jgi:hypothetical protein